MRGVRGDLIGGRSPAGFWPGRFGRMGRIIGWWQGSGVRGGITRIGREQMKMEMEVLRPDAILRLESREGRSSWKELGISLPTYEFSSQTLKVGASCHGMSCVWRDGYSGDIQSDLNFREKSKV